MSDLSQALRKSASTIILGVALAGSLAGLGYSIHSNKQMQKTYEHNMNALSDTIHYYAGKNGVTVANKDIWVGPINDAFKERFKSLLCVSLQFRIVKFPREAYKPLEPVRATLGAPGDLAFPLLARGDTTPGFNPHVALALNGDP